MSLQMLCLLTQKYKVWIGKFRNVFNNSHLSYFSLHCCLQIFVVQFADNSNAPPANISLSSAMTENELN